MSKSSDLHALLLCLMLGCSRGPHYPVARLEGSVRVGGEPVKAGQISFIAEQAERGTGVSTSIVDGHYLALDVPQGKVRVHITGNKETGKMIKYFGKMIPETVEIVPPRFRSGVALEVTGDAPQQNFDLDVE